jgi:hypothetical protein
MAGIIEMFRGSSESKEPASFTCSLGTWELLWELGQTFGWRPKGATYVAPPGRKISTPALRNYHPGEALDRKWVDADDALGWAAALDVARKSPHLDAMLNARHAGHGSDPADADRSRFEVDRFIEFARNGAFEFAVAEAAPDHAASDMPSDRERPDSRRGTES